MTVYDSIVYDTYAMCDFMVSDLNLIQAIYECMEAQAH